MIAIYELLYIIYSDEHTELAESEFDDQEQEDEFDDQEQ